MILQCMCFNCRRCLINRSKVSVGSYVFCYGPDDEEDVETARIALVVDLFDKCQLSITYSLNLNSFKNVILIMFISAFPANSVSKPKAKVRWFYRRTDVVELTHVTIKPHEILFDASKEETVIDIKRIISMCKVRLGQFSL